jgi:hypothetical protein
MEKDAKVDLLSIGASQDISDISIQTLPGCTFDERESCEWNMPVTDVVVPGLEIGSEPGT